MTTKQNTIEALNRILSFLDNKSIVKLKPEIDLIRSIIEPKTSAVSSFWADKERSSKTRERMKVAGKSRRIQLRAIWMSSGAEKFVDYEAAAKLVNRSELTVRLAISRHNGCASFTVGDDIITFHRP